MKIFDKKGPLITKTPTTKSTTISSDIPINYVCYYNWYLFLGGMNIIQAQLEGMGINNIVNQGVNGYWYSSDSMTIKMCANSCLKYGFIYAAITPL